MKLFLSFYVQNIETLLLNVKHVKNFNVTPKFVSAFFPVYFQQQKKTLNPLPIVIFGVALIRSHFEIEYFCWKMGRNRRKKLNKHKIIQMLFEIIEKNLIKT